MTPLTGYGAFPTEETINDMIAQQQHASSSTVSSGTPILMTTYIAESRALDSPASHRRPRLLCPEC